MNARHPNASPGSFLDLGRTPLPMEPVYHGHRPATAYYPAPSSSGGDSRTLWVIEYDDDFGGTNWINLGYLKPRDTGDSPLETK